MARETRIPDSEWAIMEMAWEYGTVTAAEVIASLGVAKKWNQSTVRTLLARLVEKGALQYKVSGNRYIYRPALTRQQCVNRETTSFLEKIFGGDVRSLVAHFVNEAGLSPADLESLKGGDSRKSRQRPRHS